jgi:CHAT domain-containing protein/Tfp pilus assembly protein PilF
MKAFLLGIAFCASTLHALQFVEAPDATMQRATALSRNGQQAAAAAAWEYAADRWHEAGEPYEEARALHSAALQYDALRQWQSAIRVYQRILSLARAIHDRRGEGLALSNLGGAHRDAGDLEQALNYGMQANAILRTSGSYDDHRLGLRQTIQTLRALGRLDDTRALLSDLLGYSLAARDEPEEWRARREICGVFRQLVRYPAAIDCYAKLLDLARKRENVPAQIDAYYEVAWIHAKRRKLEAALSVYQNGLQLARESNSPAWIGRIQADIAGILLDQLRYPEALMALEEALPYAKAAGDRVTQAVIFESRAITYRSMGNYDNALRAYLDALAVVPESENPDEAASIRGNLAILYQTLGDHEKAIVHFDRATKLRASHPDRARAAGMLAGLATSKMRLGAAEEAEMAFEKALAVIRAIPDPRGEAMILDNMSDIYVARGELPKALKLREQALLATRQGKDVSGEAFTLLNLGATHLALGSLDKASEAFQQSLTIAEKLGSESLEASCLASLGAISENCRQWDEALDYYERALSIRERVRSATTLPEIRTRLGEVDATPVVYGRVALLQLRRSRPERAFETTERARARVFLDQLAGADRGGRRGIDATIAARELEVRRQVDALDRAYREELSRPELMQDAEVLQDLASRLQTAQQAYDEVLTEVALADPEYARLVTAKTSRLEEIQRELGVDTTLISYYFTRLDTIAFVVSGESLRAVVLDTTHEQVAELVTAFRAFTSEADAAASLQRLYAMLFQPIEEHVQTVSVAIVPHGVLNDLPFAALMKDGESYLLDRRAVFTVPSASALVLLRQRPAERRGTTLAMAVSDAAGFAHLRHAETEARAVAAKRGTKALLNAAANEKALRAQAPNLNVLHIAAHGNLNADVPSLSRLMLAPDAENDGALTASEVSDLDLRNTSLAVLSGCETQAGKRSSGDDVVALNRAFLYAGARSVVASLWSVDDDSTAALMTAFYAALDEGPSKAVALQKAQLETRKKYPHPYYWAAFVISGDGARPLVR